MKHNYGSVVILSPDEQKTSYKWVAHANSRYPDTIFINKDDRFWLKLGDKRMIRNLQRIFSHEPIHNIIWDMNIFDENYDYLVQKFKKQIKKECPKTYREMCVF